jgi:hypothetical protein
MFEQNNDTGLDANHSRGRDKPKPERRRRWPHQERHDPPARTCQPAVFGSSDPTLCHMIGVARGMARRNIASGVCTLHDQINGLEKLACRANRRPQHLTGSTRSQALGPWPVAEWIAAYAACEHD